MPPRRTRRGGDPGKSYNSMKTSDIRKQMRSLRKPLDKLEGEGESLTLKEREHHGVLARKFAALQRILESRGKTFGAYGGRRTRRR